MKSLFLLLSSLLFVSTQLFAQQEKSTPLDLPQASPESVGLTQGLLDTISQEMSDGKYGYIDHLMIIQSGKIIFDEGYQVDYQSITKEYNPVSEPYDYYHPDWHPYYQGTKLHTLQSATKSITGLLIGIAMEEGLFEDLDEKVWTILQKESQGTLHDSITIADMLTMRGGLDWDEQSVPYTDPTNNCAIMEQSDHWVDYIVQQPMDTLPGTTFNYNGGMTVLLGKIIEIRSGMPLAQWAEEKLFKPLGIHEYYWKKSPAGELDTEGGLYLSTHDFAKFGLLMRNKGKWNGQQLINSQWMKTSLSPLVKVDDYHNYGYQWWQFHYDAEDYRIEFAGGYGDQFLFWNEEKDLLIVTHGWNIFQNERKELRYNFSFLLYDRLP